jgi:hypothetical protein
MNSAQLKWFTSDGANKHLVFKSCGSAARCAERLCLSDLSFTKFRGYASEPEA